MPDRRRLYWKEENYTHRLARWCKRCLKCKKLKCDCENPIRCNNRFIPRTSNQFTCPECYKDSMRVIAEKRINRDNAIKT